MTLHSLLGATFLAANALAAVDDPSRVHTDRADALVPPVPVEDDAFVFAVYGDRTGGPADGVKILAQAVADTNLIEPDLVMTVGDLVQGYNTRAQWIPQMTQYRAIMDQLSCPWFPVAGNHDIYWRGEGRPPEEHEGDYEAFFSPLWYAFDHKGCRFIVLYTDEGNPESGERSFSKPSSQRMSDRQTQWLQGILDTSSGKRHVFVFCHHPRWRGGRYGDDWARVHRMLVEAGNVSAVFGGHVHRLRYDGAPDGIEYMSLSSVGAHIPEVMPAAGWLHHINLVTVRDDHIAMATIPVGEILDPRLLTTSHLQSIDALRADGPGLNGPLTVHADGSVVATVGLRLANPTEHDVEWSVTPVTSDPRWSVRPEHLHERVEPGGELVVPLEITRPAGWDDRWAIPSLDIQAEVLAETVRWTLPGISRTFTARPSGLQPATPGGHLELHGRGACVTVPSTSLEFDDGPLTIETWVNPRDLSGRRGLIAKTEGSEYGLFATDAMPSVHVHVGGKYVEVHAQEPLLTSGVWHHVAGVYDGSEVRLYVDGVLVGTAQGTGPRTLNPWPLVVGGDVGSDGRPTSTVDADLDEVRLSRSARYVGDRFTPQRRFVGDEDTLLHLGLNARRGPFVADASGHEAHGVLEGGADISPDSAGN